MLGFTLKETENPSPRIHNPYLVTVDVDGAARLYIRFWERGLFRCKESPAAVQAGLEGLAQDYHLNTRPEPLPAFEPRHAYTATFSNQGLLNAGETLLQIGAQARFHLFVEPQRNLASFIIGTQRDLEDFLTGSFRNVQPIPIRTYKKAAQGRRYRADTFTELTLSRLPGIEEANPLPVPLHAPDSQGGLRLGETLNPLSRQPVGSATVPFERLQRQTLVAGTTGAGKTNTVLNLLHQAHDDVDGILIFDVKKEYRCLHDTLDADVYGFHKDFRLTHNLLKPVGPTTRWIKQFASIFSEVISRNVPASGSKDVIAEEIDNLYARRGIYDGSRDYPHIVDLLEHLEARAQNTLADREKGWIASARRVLKSLTIGETKRAFCVKQGLNLDRLLEGVNVIELDGIGDPAAEALLISVLLQKIRNDRMDARASRDLSLLIVVEEAQNILAEGQEASSIITTTCREIRSLGVGMIYVTQMPSRFSSNAVANVNTILSHKLIHPDDKHFIGQMMGLDRDHANALEGLTVGNALLKTDGLSLARIPEVDRPTVRDEDLPDHRTTRQDIATNFAHRTDVENKLQESTPREKQVFLTVAEAEAVYHSAISDKLGYAGTDISQILGGLVRKGLLRYSQAKKDGAPKPRTIYYLSPEGLEAYKQKKGSYPDRGPKAGSGHTEAQAKVVRELELDNLPHDRFDILFEQEDGERVAIEVETGSNNNEQLLENLRKSLEAQGRAVFVATNPGGYNWIMQMAAKHNFDTGEGFTLHLALIDDLGPVEEWDYFVYPSRD